MGPTRDAEPASDSSNEDFLFHLYRGSELLQDNRVHEAKEELERALHLQPRDSKGHDLLAVVYFRLGLYPRAIHIYEQLQRRSPDDTALLLNLALCYLKTEQPELARQKLEHLVELNPSHARAWGYLGLACERTGDLVEAERAFMKGGHPQMARRVAARRDGEGADAATDTATDGEPPSHAASGGDAVYQELDAGELSFTLAEPHKPDTRDGPPPMIPSLPNVGPSPPNRRPTLIAPVGAPPAHDGVDYSASRIPPQRSPSIVLEDLAALTSPSVRRPVVSVPSPFGPPRSHDPPARAPGTRTLPPPSVVPGAAPRTPLGIGPLPARMAASLLHADEHEAARFPDAGVVLHASGLALVRVTSGGGFAARLESIRAQQSGLDMKLLERSVKGKPSGEPFGGVASPMVLASGDGQLVLAARPGRKISALSAGEEMCFVREDVLLGFGAGLAFENGRLTTGDGEWLAVVQLRGEGSVLIEARGESLTLAVRPDRSLNVRREVILGWFGRLVPRSLSPADGPCGQRGLVSFAGDGRVLVAST